MKLYRTILEVALIGLESQRDKVEKQIADVRQMLRQRPDARHSNPIRKTAAPPKERARLSAAARRRVAAPQKQRWAQFHARKKAEAK